MSKKIVVAGGTGFLGRHISRKLLDAGFDVTVLSRHPESASKIPELAGANATKGDVTDAGSLTGTLEGAFGVVMAAQFSNHPVEVPRKGLTYDNYDRRGTENLLAEADRAGVQRFFYVSGAGANPFSDKAWYRAKGRAEEAITSSGLTYGILRPSWAYGPEDRALNRFELISRFSPVIPQLGVKPQKIMPVYVEDIADAVATIFSDDEAWGRVYEIGGPDVLTMHEVIETLLEVLGRKRLILPLPVALLKITTAPLVALPKPLMTPFGIEFAVQDGLVDNSAIELLGIKPRPLRAGLEDYLVR